MTAIDWRICLFTGYWKGKSGIKYRVFPFWSWWPIYGSICPGRDFADLNGIFLFTYLVFPPFVSLSNFLSPHVIKIIHCSLQAKSYNYFYDDHSTQSFPVPFGNYTKSQTKQPILGSHIWVQKNNICQIEFLIPRQKVLMPRGPDVTVSYISIICIWYVV